MKILLIFSGLGQKRGGSTHFMTSTQKCSIIGVSCCINRKKMADDGREKKNSDFQTFIFAYKLEFKLAHLYKIEVCMYVIKTV